MKRVRALETFTLSSGIVLEAGQYATISDTEAQRLAKDRKVSVPHLPENRTFK